MNGTPAVRLLPVDEDVLERLLTAAVTDADPAEVMPPVAGPPGWTMERKEAFRAFHRARREGLVGALHEVTFAVAADGKIVGSGRLERKEHPVLEAGLWLVRSARGRGIGTAALQALVDEAARAGAVTVITETTTTNPAALAALRRSGSVITVNEDSGHVHAELHLTWAPGVSEPMRLRRCLVHVAANMCALPRRYPRAWPS